MLSSANSFCYECRGQIFSEEAGFFSHSSTHSEASLIECLHTFSPCLEEDFPRITQLYLATSSADVNFKSHRRNPLPISFGFSCELPQRYSALCNRIIRVASNCSSSMDFVTASLPNEQSFLESKRREHIRKATHSP